MCVESDKYLITQTQYFIIGLYDLPDLVSVFTLTRTTFRNAWFNWLVEAIEGTWTHKMAMVSHVLFRPRFFLEIFENRLLSIPENGIFHILTVNGP